MVNREIQNWIQKNLFDAVPVDICVIDRSYHIVEANERFRTAYGEWEGRPCYSVYKGRNERCRKCAASKTFSDGRMRLREEVGRSKEGEEVHYLVHLVPLDSENGKVRHVIEMSTDISRVKILESQKREAERLAAVGETVAGIAHGIKNVLMGLEGGMYVFNTGLEKGEPERIDQGWKMVQGNVMRISRFVKEFLDFARGRTPELKPVDPALPANRVIELYKEKARLSGVTLEASLTEGMEPLAMDEAGIHDALANLVSNAIYACTVAEGNRNSNVRLELRGEKDLLVYEVSDTGCGMDYDISRRIFTSFFTNKAADEGTGLGLLTTKKIVHQHGGKVSFQTKEGQGSRFRIELPIAGIPDNDSLEAEE